LPLPRGDCSSGGGRRSSPSLGGSALFIIIISQEILRSLNMHYTQSSAMTLLFSLTHTLLQKNLGVQQRNSFSSRPRSHAQHGKYFYTPFWPEKDWSKLCCYNQIQNEQGKLSKWKMCAFERKLLANELSLFQPEVSRYFL
jgi:hypothetical protein